MRSKWLMLIGSLFLSVTLAGCGGSGGGGSDVPAPGGTEPDAIGTNACQVCHAGAHTDASALLRSRGIDSLVAPLAASETIYSVTHDCESCHGNGQFHANAPSNVDVPTRQPDQATCATCHDTVENFVSSRHANQSARTALCSACHSHEGGIQFLAMGRKVSRAELEASYNSATASAYLLPVGSDTIDGVMKKNCSTCHTPLTLALRGDADVIATGLLPANGSTATVNTTRTVYSQEFNLCTGCHTVDLDATFVPTEGYGERGMYVYELSSAYSSANLYDATTGTFNFGQILFDATGATVLDGAGNPVSAPNNIAFYHDGASGNGRTLVDTHFGGTIMSHLVNFDGSATDITIKGYNINPGNKDACTICHDPHTAGKLLSIDSSSASDYADQLDNQAVSYAEGLGDFHTNYLDDPFSRIQAGTGCLPCHSGDAFLDVIQGGALSDTGWQVIGCRSCHELNQPNTTPASNDSAAFAEVREFPAGYEFKFNSNVVVNVADLGVNQVCFECHKGRTPGVDVAALADPVGGTRNYDISYLHYAPSMAILFGDEAKMVATYPGKTYAGRFQHYDGAEFGCVDCHNVHDTAENHAYENKMDNPDFSCYVCHNSANVANPNRPAALQARTEAFSVRLLSTILTNMQAIDTTVLPGSDLNATLKTKIVALKGAYPNASFATAEDELMAYIEQRQTYFPNKNVAHAATTWKIFTYEDGAPHGQTHGHGGSWAHNSKFARQVMFDAIESLGGSTAGLTTRPL